MPRLLAWIVLGSLLAFGSLQALSAPRTVVAQVTRARGTVTLREPQGAARSLSILDLVAEGDRLQVPAGGLAEVVLFENNHRLEVHGPASVSLGKSGLRTPEIQKGRVVVTQPPVAMHVRGGSMRDLSSDQPGGGHKRADKASLPPEHLKAFPAISLDPRPTLRWAAPQSAALFHVVVWRCGEEPVEKSTTSRPALTVSCDLERGETYIYAVTAQDQDGRQLGQESSWAMVLRDSKVTELADARKQFDVLRQLNPEDTSPYLQMAALYNQEGLLLEAVEVLRMLATVVPEAPYPHARMMALYATLGMEAERQEAARQEASRSAR